MPPLRLTRFFEKEDHGYQVSRELRAAIVFSVHDLVADAPFSRLDLISCRNLLIYLRPEVQQKVLSLFHFALREGGILFLGSIGIRGRRQRPFRADLQETANLSAYRPQPAGRSRASPRPRRGHAVAVAETRAADHDAAQSASATSRSDCCSRAMRLRRSWSTESIKDCITLVQRTSI